MVVKTNKIPGVSGMGRNGLFPWTCLITASLENLQSRQPILVFCPGSRTAQRSCPLRDLFASLVLFRSRNPQKRSLFRSAEGGLLFLWCMKGFSDFNFLIQHLIQLMGFPYSTTKTCFTFGRASQISPPSFLDAQGLLGVFDGLPVLERHA